jgi:putative membrane protein
MFVTSTLVAAGAWYSVGLVRLWRHAGVGQGVTRAQSCAFAAGWLTLAAALLSPLDEWSERLFSAHMLQHELLMVIAAPLIAVSSSLVAYLWALPPTLRRNTMIAIRRRPVLTIAGALTAPAVVWTLHGLALWIWHLPSLYEAALGHETIHALQHLSFFGTATLFWWGLLHGRYGRAGYGAAVVYVFATAIHSGVLGALLTMSTRLWYPAYESTTSTIGLSPLEDQQLAGLLMWIPAGAIFIAGGLLFFAAWLRESERRVRYHAGRA